MNLKSCRAYMNLNHFFCGSVTLKCQFMPVINLQRPRGTRIRLTDWFIHNVIYGWLSQVISQMNTFLQGLKYHVTNQQVAAFPRRNTMCASQMTNFTLLLSFKSVSFFFLSVSLSLRRQTVSTRERRTLPLWRGVVTCHSDMWEQRACPLDRPAGWAGLQLFSFVNAGRSLITAVIFV